MPRLLPKKVSATKTCKTHNSKVCRFLQSVSREQIIGFLASWNRKRDHKQRIYISYDSTNKNSQAGDISFVEFGNAKDDKGRFKLDAAARQKALAEIMANEG